MSVFSEEFRVTFLASDRKRDEGLTTPADVERYDHLQYGPEKEWQVLDVYRPKQLSGRRLPVIFSFHGGGWVYGSKEIYQFYCMSLAERGFAVINYTYRLAPEFQFPAPLEDCNLVMQWMIDHQDEYLFDTDHVYGVGDSAGASGLGLYACLYSNPEYAEELGIYPPRQFCLRAIALNCGIYNLETEVRRGKCTLTEDFFPDHGSPEELRLTNVLDWITPMYPPTFVMTAWGDFLREAAPELVDRLSEENVPHIYRLYGDETNPLGHVFHCDVKSEDARGCNDDETAFFRQWSQRNIHTILFDMDGVLIDSEKIYNRFWRQAAAELGIPITWEMSLKLRSMNREDGRLLFGEWFDDPDRYDTLRDRRMQLMAEYLQDHEFEPKPQAAETLQWLRAHGYRNCVVTATAIDMAMEKLTKLGLAPLVDQVVSGKQCKRGKPNPDPYLYACEQMGVAPEDCYAVEDSENGILSAWRAGCYCIMIPDLAEPGPDIRPYLTARVGTIGELKEYLH